MKFFRLMIIVSLVVIISCTGDKTQIPANVVNIPNSANGNDNKGDLPVIQFSALEHDFGKAFFVALETPQASLQRFHHRHGLHLPPQPKK